MNTMPERQCLVNTTGILRYSPSPLGDRELKNWWLVVDCDKQIGRYYRALYALEHTNCRKLQRAAWEEHISVVRNEPPNEEFWGKHEGKVIKFEYEPSARNDGLFFWLDVTCPELLNIREELGLPREPEFGLHLTIGNGKENN